MPEPGPREAIVAVAYAGICHTDHYILHGGHPAVSYPVVPGHEVSGTVVSVGREIAGVHEGDAVAVQTQLGCGVCDSCRQDQLALCRAAQQLGSTVDGGWQSHLTLEQQSLYRLPEQLSLRDGALVEPAANGHAAARAAEIADGDTVVVIGPGPIGLLALQFAKLARPGMLALVGRSHDARRLELGRELGADVTIADDDPLEPLLQRTDGRGADVVIQCAGSVEAFKLALAVARPPRARIVIEGYAARGEGVVVEPDSIAVQQTTIRGVNGWSLDDFRSAIARAAAGEIALGRLLTDTFALTDFERAIAASTDYAAGTVKAAFTPERVPDRARSPQLDSQTTIGGNR